MLGFVLYAHVAYVYPNPRMYMQYFFPHVFNIVLEYFETAT